VDDGRLTVNGLKGKPLRHAEQRIPFRLEIFYKKLN